ncbi:MAG: hypothetical protein JZU65_06715 [Chlorobium sp.]|nr:hypothetical protein [Chlorobium sp.]
MGRQVAFRIGEGTQLFMDQVPISGQAIEAGLANLILTVDDGSEEKTSYFYVISVI